MRNILYIMLTGGLLLLIIFLLITPEPNKKEDFGKEVGENQKSVVESPHFRTEAKRDFVDGIDSISTTNYANPILRYYYYIPKGVILNKEQKHYALIMVPPLSGLGQNFVTPMFKIFANEENLIIISPSFIFDEKNWATQTSYQYPSVWSGRALEDIIQRFEESNSIKISGIFLFGFSAGAQFAIRFSLWKPEICIACAAHGSGGTIIPERYVDVKFFVSVGTMDTDRIEKAKTFYESARKLGIDVIYKEYNTGHSMTQEQINDALEFIREVKGQK